MACDSHPVEVNPVLPAPESLALVAGIQETNIRTMAIVDTPQDLDSLSHFRLPHRELHLPES